MVDDTKITNISVYHYMTFSINVCCSEYSMQLNASRIKVLQAQDDLVSAMRETASKDLLNVSHYKSRHLHNYEGLLRALIIQVQVKKSLNSLYYLT